MANRRAINDAMANAARSARKPADEQAETPQPRAEVPSGPHYRPGRAGKTNVTGFFPPEVKKELRLLAAERETTIQELLAEALNDLFAKYGRPECAPLARNR